MRSILNKAILKPLVQSLLHWVSCLLTGLYINSYMVVGHVSKRSVGLPLASDGTPGDHMKVILVDLVNTIVRYG